MSEHDESPLFECGPPTPEEREALAAIFRKHVPGAVDDNSPMIVLRVHTADDLRADADAIADHFERASPRDEDPPRPD